MKKKIIFFLIPSAWAVSDPSKGLGCGGGFGPLAELLCPEKSPTTETVGIQLNRVIGNFISFLTVLAGLWYLFQFIIAGYQWLSSGGDKNNLETARNKIIHSTIGLVLIVSAWVIVGLLSKVLDLDILNPGELLQTMGL